MIEGKDLLGRVMGEHVFKEVIFEQRPKLNAKGAGQKCSSGIGTD